MSGSRGDAAVRNEPLKFLRRHEQELRQVAAEEQKQGRFTAWLSRAIEYLDEHGQTQASDHAPLR